MKAVKQCGVNFSSIHLDSSSFHVDGEYLSDSSEDSAVAKEDSPTSDESANAQDSAAAKFEQSLKYHRLEDLKFIPQAHYDKAGRPRQAEEPTRITYQIQATLIANLEVLDVEMTRAGRFILASNVL